MEIIQNLFKDLYFWISFILFGASIAGILWILNNLKEHHEDEPAYIPSSPSAPPRDPVFDRDSTSRIITEPRSAEPAASPVTMEILAERLSRIEKQVFELSNQLKSGPTNDDLGLEIKALIQALKSGAGTPADSKALSQLSLKVDKMYKVIVSLSGVEEQQ